MAGGGTGGVLGPRNPTDPIKITPGATPGVNPIGGVKAWKDSFTQTTDGSGFIWSGNPGEAVPVYFLGDKNGNIIPETSANIIETQGLSAGSPITVMSAINKIINDKMAIPGEIAKLKQSFIDKEFLVGAYAKKSMANPDLPDAYFRQALADALYLQSLSNIKLAQEGAKKFMNFDDFILNVGKQGDPNNGGTSVDGTRKSITYQKFAAEDYDIAVDQLFQQTIGRGASDEELKDFIAKLQAYGDKNPQKEINKVSNNGKTQIATQSGGVSNEAAMAMARDQALATPEAESYNKATKYLEYFREALDSPIQLGQ
jgi:hypothetical protein